MKLSFSTVAIVLLSVLSLSLLIDKHIHKYTIFHNDANVPMNIGDRLILEVIDPDGTMHIVREEESNEVNEPELIWNDDAESLPAEGESVRIELVLGNKVYLEPIY